MFSRGKTSIAKYVVYYEKKIPNELELFAFRDQNASLVKEGLREISGISVPRLILTINNSDLLTDRSRIKSFEAILQALLSERKIEHFVRIS